MAKFKVGGKVNHFAKGDGVVVKYATDTSVAYPIRVSFKSEDYTFTREGRLYKDEEISLRLTGRPFNVGDKVVIGGEKCTVGSITNLETTAPVRIDINDNDEIWLTTDGRAWPGTPIIAEHDWEEEIETVNKELDEAVKNSQAFSEYQNQEKESFDISPGFAKDWPIDNGIDDVTVSPEEVRHIAEMQDIDELEYRKMPKYIKMALALEGIEVDLKTADLIREIVDSVNAHGGQYDLDTSCNIRQKIEEKYV